MLISSSEVRRRTRIVCCSLLREKEEEEESYAALFVGERRRRRRRRRRKEERAELVLVLGSLAMRAESWRACFADSDRRPAPRDDDRGARRRARRPVRRLCRSRVRGDARTRQAPRGAEGDDRSSQEGTLALRRLQTLLLHLRLRARRLRRRAAGAHSSRIIISRDPLSARSSVKSHYIHTSDYWHRIVYTRARRPRQRRGVYLIYCS